MRLSKHHLIVILGLLLCMIDAKALETNVVPVSCSYSQQSQRIFATVTIDLPQTNLPKNPRYWWIQNAYFMATNSFIGPIELRDVENKDVRLLRPGVNSTNAYPASYSLAQLDGLLRRQYRIYSGPPLPLPFNGTASFYLNEYFSPQKAGRYRLTIWPKIYKRESPTNDICSLMNIPPVTISINWQGKSQK